ncbi:hypothetical protein GCM10028807_47730 [Spirosoma daeguense]
MDLGALGLPISQGIVAIGDATPTTATDDQVLTGFVSSIDQFSTIRFPIRHLDELAPGLATKAFTPLQAQKPFGTFLLLNGSLFAFLPLAVLWSCTLDNVLHRQAQGHKVLVRQQGMMQ